MSKIAAAKVIRDLPEDLDDLHYTVCAVNEFDKDHHKLSHAYESGFFAPSLRGRLPSLAVAGIGGVFRRVRMTA